MTVYVKRLSITDILMIFMVIDMLLMLVTLCTKGAVHKSRNRRTPGQYGGATPVWLKSE